MPKVTESLRRQWAMQREQMIEEREVTQDGTPRHPDDIPIQDFDIKVMDHLLGLPLGQKFDGQEEQAKLRAAEKLEK